MTKITKLIQSSILAVTVAAFSVASIPATTFGQEHVAKKAAQGTVKGVKKVGEKSKDVVSTTGEVITDGWITSRIHTRFINEKALKGSDIDVDTKDHVVTLNGTVMSAAGRNRAVAIAKDTEGVHSVVSHLKIGPKK